MDDLILELNKDAKAFMIDDCIQSYSPFNTGFGFTYHSHMIPPFKPEGVLMLGYGRGQIADLTRMVWGNDVKFTAVDKIEIDPARIEYNKIIDDAFEYIIEQTDGNFYGKYDYVCVDLWEGNDICEEVFSDDFAVALKKKTRYLLCMNIPVNRFSDMENIFKVGFEFLRSCHIDGNLITWWKNV